MPPPTFKVWKFFKRCNGLENCQMPVTDSLAWWKDNSDKYSRLSVLACQYLAVLSERIFSAAGLIVTKLRNRLIVQIIFLNKNSVPQ